MDINFDFNKIISNFKLPSSYTSLQTLNNGHINNTYLLSYPEKSESYIIQNINTYVFKNPEYIMQNIKHVTSFIKQKYIASGVIPHGRVLEFLNAKDGNNFCYDDDGLFWRAYKFVDNSSTYDLIDSPDLLYNVGAGFGEFQRLLIDFPIGKLHETIPNFHNTKLRMKDFFEAVAQDEAGRASFVQKEINFFRERAELASRLIDMQENGTLPLRVTHNDTKANNILIDNTTGKAVCVIDLDTVMPGLTAYDFGDAIRYAANTEAEDSTEFSKVALNFDYYKAFAKGFITASKGHFTKAEIESMAWGARIITIELASRFLADYLNGDKYFKIHRPNHNLDRAKNQIALALDMEKHFDRMCEIIESYAY